MLIGVPGSGKTTWIGQQPFDWSRTVTASTDDYVERIAGERNTTYSAVFEEVMPAAVRHMVDVVLNAVSRDHDIIWDQTSLTPHSRAKKFRMLPAQYEVIGIVFPTPPRRELQRRLSARSGKIIPQSVLNAMIHTYVEPTFDEGFAQIIHMR